MTDIQKQPNFLVRVYRFYANGFRTLTPMSKTLWLIIGLKLFVMFAILKVFFFPNHLKNEANKEDITRSEWLQKDLIERGQSATNTNQQTSTNN